MDTLNDRIRKRRKELKLTQQDVAKFVGVSRVSVSQWETGETAPKGENLLSIANFLHCSPQWLMSGDEEPEEPSFTYVKQDSHHGISTSFPLINWEQAANWPQPASNVASLKRYPCLVPCSKHTFVLKVQSISMQPKFEEGSFIFVDPEVEPSSGKYVVVRQPGRDEVIFRQLLVEGSQKFLQPTNPDWPEKIIAIDEGTQIVGTVIFTGLSV